MHRFLPLFLLPATLPARAADQLPDTQLLTDEGDLAAKMVEGIDKYLTRALDDSDKKREEFWNVDYSSVDAYLKAVAPKRERLKKILGVVDPRVPFTDLEYVGGPKTPSLVAETDDYKVFAVRWPLLPGVEGDGLLLEPEKFRVLQRKANALGLTLFSFIARQHAVTLDWLTTLPNVDADRIAFYGLSYGGKTAMRIPPIEPRYSLSICSGDFNDNVAKNASVDYSCSFLFTLEYEMPEWNTGDGFNYAEMAALIAPRPFMVERGHDDGVAVDEVVASECAKVRRLYSQLKIPDRTDIEFFAGGHEIHGEGTFRFLQQHLGWPR
ncbi:MAG TPA: hypothetical protein VMS17_32875 [Gemmataceae bacterium]|nr:hypothetical protein [Gemmataceae bacterium]